MVAREECQKTVKLSFIFVGKAKEAYLEEGINNYLGRVRRYLPADVSVVKAEPIRKGADEAAILRAEGERILSRVESGDHLCCLERTGRQLSSEGLAAWIEDLANRGTRRVVFVVGGALGLSKEVLGRADSLWSLSTLTLTHEMARLVLMEQLFRALTIRAGEPYHK
jgi:23S rRNA (pseudouridine1915-N3)-methyltransferase